MPRKTALNTIKLPVRFGRFLGRKLDPRRRKSLEDSLRIGNSRLEERQRKLNQRAAEREQQASATPLTPQEKAYEAEQTKGRRRIASVFEEIFNVAEVGGLIFRLLSVIVRGLLRVIGGVLEGLSIFDI